MLLLHADDLVLFANRSTKVYEGIEKFCMLTKLSVNDPKQEIMLIKSPPKNHALSHLIVWKTSNILALKFLQVIDGTNILNAA